MSGAHQIDVERVICRLSEITDPGARGFTIGTGDWPLRGFVVRVRDAVRGYVNHCPHAGHPLDLIPQRFLTRDGALILCSSHGALFDKLSGFCIAGPCAGQYLAPISLKVEGGFVLLADEVDVGALMRSIER
ncbi:MAG TPA: Rieske 2Fe-2S domain-containing protein [Steroidobacteraceae bacterium]